MMTTLRPAQARSVARTICSQCRAKLLHSSAYSSLSSSGSPTVQPLTSPFAPRHFLSIADLTPSELTTLVVKAHRHKKAIKGAPSSSSPYPMSLAASLTGKTVAITMSKRSTRTRVSTEAAVVALGGHPMFLGKDDIQLGVNESLHDTAVVISSMVAGIVSRVHAHSDVADIAKHSTVPVINGLSEDFHPLQSIADALTIYEHFSPFLNSPDTSSSSDGPAGPSLGLEGLKIAWVGDANNVLYDLAIAAGKLGMQIHVATPRGYEMTPRMRDIINQSAEKPTLSETTVPEEAVKDADIIVTDTWVSMGQESDAAAKMRAFEGFQVNADLIKRSRAREGWKFMHCLPRKPQEVSDEVFYSPNSLVFHEAENRLWGAISVLESFIVKGGKIV